LISVGLPVVKTQFLKQAIKSILDQSFRDFELIILNNGAPPDAKEIISEFKDTRIRYYENEKQIPVIENWNKVLSYATGDYFVLFSDDDLYEKDFLTEMNKLAVKYPDINIFHCRLRIIDENNKTAYLSSTSPEIETVADFIWHKIKSYRFHAAPDFMVKTESIRKIGGFVPLPFAWFSDDATWYLIANDNRIAASPKILCSWRESAFHLAKKSKVADKLNAIKMFFNWLEDFLKNKIKIQSETDTETIEQIKLNIPTKIAVSQGSALKAGAPSNYFGFVKLFFLWLQFRRKYYISITAYVWANGLLVKEIKRNSHFTR